MTGDDPPAIAIERMLTAVPVRAAPMMISQVSWTSLSGLTGQVMNEISGRRTKAAMPPAIAAPMSTMRRSSSPSPGPMKTCLLVLVNAISALWSWTTAWETSWAPRARS